MVDPRLESWENDNICGIDVISSQYFPNFNLKFKSLNLHLDTIQLVRKKKRHILREKIPQSYNEC